MEAPTFSVLQTTNGRLFTPERPIVLTQVGPIVAAKWETVEGERNVLWEHVVPLQSVARLSRVKNG